MTSERERPHLAVPAGADLVARHNRGPSAPLVPNDGEIPTEQLSAEQKGAYDFIMRRVACVPVHIESGCRTRSCSRR
jgi:hypothetical protein